MAGGGWGMDIKEGPGYDEHWALYLSDESLNSTSETNITLYVTWNSHKNTKKRVAQVAQWFSTAFGLGRP